MPISCCPCTYYAPCNTAIPIYTVVSGYAVFCPGLQKGTFARGITFWGHFRARNCVLRVYCTNCGQPILCLKLKCGQYPYRIIVVSTCRCSVQFGCYITWPWMAKCVSVMIKMLPLFNFTISCHGRLAWKTSRCVCALGGSRFWLVESTLFGDHVSLRVHREFSLKFNLSN